MGAREFFSEVVDGIYVRRDPETVERYFADDFVQHSPVIADGKPAMRDAVGRYRDDDVRFEVLRTIVDGDLAVVHTRSTREGAPSYVNMHLFRLDGERVVEQWEALQEEITETVGGRSMVDGPNEITDLAATEDNKKLVQRLVEQVFLGKDWTVLDDFVEGDEFIQHDPHIPDGAWSVPAAFAMLEAMGQPMTYEKLHRVVGEGNYVFVQCEGQCVTKPHAFYSIFRLENGSLREHWDAVVELPHREEIPHGNPLF